MAKAVRRSRLDAELVRRGLARSRDHASELIAAGKVKVSGALATKPATGVGADAPILVDTSETDDPGYASRGAHKLVGALEAFSGVQVKGRRCLDAGASTGGFTDVLLRNGAAGVIAVDVGYGQLVWSLQTDDRVTVMDRTNVRTLTLEDIGGDPVELVVSDLSFISLTMVLPALIGVVEPDGDLVLMVKPQFEVGKERLGKGGVVRDPELRADAVRGVAAKAAELGWGVEGVAASPLPGPSGNVEYFLWIRRTASVLDETMLRTAIESGPQ
ncbi:MAG TPA: TlyA family RNA methyltransferase [Kribbella sp.]